MHRALLGSALLLAACTDRPIDVTTSPSASTATTTATTGGTDPDPSPTDPGPPSTSTSSTTNLPATTGVDTTDPVVTTTAPADTTDPADTSTSDDPSSDSASTTATTSTTDAHPACGECPETWVSGDLKIFSGTPLDQFECLGEIDGYLSLQGDFTAAELAVFANLRHTTQLVLQNNTVLTDMSAFACLETIEQDLTIHDAPALADMSALSNVTFLRTLELCDVGITAVPAFAPGLKEVQRVELRDLPQLTDIGPMAGWIADTNNLSIYIDNAPLLTSVAPLVGLIGSKDGVASVALWDLPLLTSVDGVGSIVEGNLSLRNLPTVPDLAPLAGLTKIEGLELTGMPKVTDLTGLANLEDADNIILGNCDVDGPNPSGMDGLVDLSGLSSLVHVQVLQIGGNTNLADLTGAPALHDCYAMFVADNPKLTLADYDALAAQLDQPPEGCFSKDGLSCSCTTLMP